MWRSVLGRQGTARLAGLASAGGAGVAPLAPSLAAGGLLRQAHPMELGSGAAWGLGGGGAPGHHGGLAHGTALLGAGDPRGPRAAPGGLWWGEQRGAARGIGLGGLRGFADISKTKPLRELKDNEQGDLQDPLTYNLIQEEEGTTKLTGVYPGGFVVNGAQVQGSVICLSTVWMMWKAETFDGITPDSLSVLQVLKRPPEIVIVGCGKTMRPLGKPMVAWLRANNMTVEVMDTRNAVATFNILVQEGRSVAGLLIPP